MGSITYGALLLTAISVSNVATAQLLLGIQGTPWKEWYQWQQRLFLEKTFILTNKDKIYVIY